MILPDWKIKEYINAGKIIVNPFDENLINPNSLDLRLGGNFSIVRAKTSMLEKEGLVDPSDKTSFTTEMFNGDTCILDPGQMVLASLFEDVTLPDFICAEIKGKSSLGRLGLDNSSCAGWVDAGWSGVLTIELFNHSQNRIILTKGMKIGQILFYETLPAAKPYGVVGRYQNQKPGQGSFGV